MIAAVAYRYVPWCRCMRVYQVGLDGAVAWPASCDGIVLLVDSTVQYSRRSRSEVRYICTTIARSNKSSDVTPSTRNSSTFQLLLLCRVVSSFWCRKPSLTWCRDWHMTQNTSLLSCEYHKATKLQSLNKSRTPLPCTPVPWRNWRS